MLSGLAPDTREKVTHFMYDDMCHLRLSLRDKDVRRIKHIKFQRNMPVKRPELAEMNCLNSLLDAKCACILCILSESILFDVFYRNKCHIIGVTRHPTNTAREKQTHIAFLSSKLSTVKFVNKLLALQTTIAT